MKDRNNAAERMLITTRPVELVMLSSTTKEDVAILRDILATYPHVWSNLVSISEVQRMLGLAVLTLEVIISNQKAQLSTMDSAYATDVSS
ncbi:hypothetical protein LQW54_000871 [Pestalotiopsis sp. IQ-011]